MKKVFKNTAKFDENAVNLGIKEIILQENAASFVANLIRQKIPLGSKILFICGGGNNGADGFACARMLQGDYKCEMFLNKKISSNLAQTQLDLARRIGVKTIARLDLNEVSCVVDAIFGSGLSRNLDTMTIEILEEANKFNGLKIAVDMPSGLDLEGNLRPICFKADYTIAMGALKLALFSDLAKDFVGEIVVADLGLSHCMFANKNEDFVLELADLKLPKRDIQNVSKGDFGHAFVAVGDMSGAAQMTAIAALNMGAGRVSVVGENFPELDMQIMLKNDFNGADAVAFGMGLGEKELIFTDLFDKKTVVDADMFYKQEILDFARNPNSILTPHPKEFANLMKIANLEPNLDANLVQQNRFELARKFTQNFPCVLVLKGSNTIIAQNGVLYINPLGSNKLSVGGSGDVLSGVILAYLAQNYEPLDAAINGVLAHSKTALNYNDNAYSFTPQDIIKGLKCL